MPAAVRLAGRIGGGMLMNMMGVVTMPVLVPHYIVGVPVIVALDQVQPQSKAHQAASDQ